MSKLIKGTLLFTALLLPVLIFVFLKMFGENKFDIPVYNYEQISDKANCDDIKLPHVVKELNTEGQRIINTDYPVNIYHIIGQSVNEPEMRGLMKVKDRLDEEEVGMYSIGKLDSSISKEILSKKYQIGGIWRILEIDKQSLSNFVDCELIIPEAESLVLVDKEGKIRGYYNGEEKEETDRLILESKILLYGDRK